MRADRLVAIILSLQTRGQATAGQLAEELEVSERTIRRDLDALLVSGVPLYPQRGRGGGWALLGGHKLNVSGLTADEAQALMLVAGPGALAGLGLEGGAKSALRKLVAALPAPVREQALAANQVIHRDDSAWSPTARPHGDTPAHLPVLRDALMSGVQVDLGYRRPGSEPSVRRVHPLGLVLNRQVWYLLATTDKGRRTFRVSRIESVERTDEPVVRPEGVQLEEMWAEARAGFSERMGVVPVRFRIAEGAGADVAARLGDWVPVTAVGHGEYEAVFPHEHVAAVDFVRLGAAVEVLSPASVRGRLVDIGRDLVERYG